MPSNANMMGMKKNSKDSKEKEVALFVCMLMFKSKRVQRLAY